MRKSQRNVVLSIWLGMPVGGTFWRWNESRTDGVFPDHGWIEPNGVGTRSGSLSDAAGVQLLEPVRSLCGDGVRSADIQGEFARYRGLSSYPRFGRLSDGHSWTGDPHQSGLRQRPSRLARFRRGDCGADAASTATVRGNAAGLGLGS